MRSSIRIRFGINDLVRGIEVVKKISLKNLNQQD
jgi:hypothetical protein